MRIKISVVVYCALLSLAFVPAHADEAADRARLEELRKSIAELQKELEATRSSRDELQKSLQSSEKTIGELSEKARQIQKQLDDGKVKLKNLNDERSELQIKKKSQQKFVSQHLKSAWQLGQQSSVRLLLNQQEPARVARNLKYYDYIIQARAEKITAYMGTIERLNKIEPEITYETEKLQSNFSRLQNQRQALQSEQSQRKKTLDKLLADLRSGDARLKNLQNDRTRLQRILTNVKQFLSEDDLQSNAESFASLKGKLPWPTNGRILHNYGSARVGNRLRWEGMLIGATTGNPVVAVHHGRVVYSDYLRGHGLLLIVDHGGGYMTLYAHNEVLYKELGEWVNRGETIATVGTSGGQERAALYFELRHKGEPTNPRSWFKPA